MSNTPIVAPTAFLGSPGVLGNTGRYAMTLAPSICLLAGIGLSIYTVWFWSGRSFGALSTSSTIRLVVPAAMLMILGLETVLASFFLSILGINRR